MKSSAFCTKSCEHIIVGIDRNFVPKMTEIALGKMPRWITMYFINQLKVTPVKNFCLIFVEVFPFAFFFFMLPHTNVRYRRYGACNCVNQESFTLKTSCAHQTAVIKFQIRNRARRRNAPSKIFRSNKNPKHVIAFEDVFYERRIFYSCVPFSLLSSLYSIQQSGFNLPSDDFSFCLKIAQIK